MSNYKEMGSNSNSYNGNRRGGGGVATAGSSGRARRSLFSSVEKIVQNVGSRISQSIEEARKSNPNLQRYTPGAYEALESRQLL